MDNLTFNLVCSIILLELELVKLKLQLKQLCSMLYVLFLTSGFVCVLAPPSISASVTLLLHLWLVM